MAGEFWNSITRFGTRCHKVRGLHRKWSWEIWVQQETLARNNALRSQMLFWSNGGECNGDRWLVSHNFQYSSEIQFCTKCQCCCNDWQCSSVSTLTDLKTAPILHKSDGFERGEQKANSAIEEFLSTSTKMFCNRSMVVNPSPHFSLLGISCVKSGADKTGLWLNWEY